MRFDLCVVLLRPRRTGNFCCNAARNSCRSRIEFYVCDVARNKLHRVTPSKILPARNVARKGAPCVRVLSVISVVVLFGKFVGEFSSVLFVCSVDKSFVGRR